MKLLESRIKGKTRIECRDWYYQRNQSQNHGLNGLKEEHGLNAGIDIIRGIKSQNHGLNGLKEKHRLNTRIDIIRGIKSRNHRLNGLKERHRLNTRIDIICVIKLSESGMKMDEKTNTDRQ